MNYAIALKFILSWLIDALSNMYLLRSSKRYSCWSKHPFVHSFSAHQYQSVILSQNSTTLHVFHRKKNKTTTYGPTYFGLIFYGTQNNNAPSNFVNFFESEWIDERLVRWCGKIALAKFHFGTFIKRLRINVTKERLKMLLLCRDIINHLSTISRSAEDAFHLYQSEKKRDQCKQKKTNSTWEVRWLAKSICI